MGKAQGSTSMEGWKDESLANIPNPQFERVSREPLRTKNFTARGTEVGALVDEKNQAYGDSFSKAGEVLALLYPQGVQPSQFQDMLTITRVIDKLFRIATAKNAFGESPWNDIAGYALLSLGKK